MTQPALVGWAIIGIVLTSTLFILGLGYLCGIVGGKLVGLFYWIDFEFLPHVKETRELHKKLCGRKK